MSTTIEPRVWFRIPFRIRVNLSHLKSNFDRDRERGVGTMPGIFFFLPPLNLIFLNAKL
jgi:hypothetical protein